MAKMMLKRKVVLTAVFSAALLAGTAPALAGFEWKRPATRAESDIDWNSSVPAMPAQKIPSIEAVPIPAEPVKNEAAAAPVDVVSGFGSDLPLTVALQQILPPEYGFSFAAGVDRETNVSWTGEKPWQQVVTDMLKAQGLGFSMEGNVVVVKQLADDAQPTPITAAPSKADMIPSDMISDTAGGNTSAAAPAPAPVEEIVSAPAPVTPEKPVPVTIRREKPTQLLEKEIPVEAVAEAAPPEEVLSAVEELAAAPTTPAAIPAPAWHATKGQTLRAILNDWSEVANVGLYWSIDYDYRLSEDINFSGSFDEVVGKLFDKFVKVRPQPYGRLHRAPNGDKVLVVNSYDVSN